MHTSTKGQNVYRLKHLGTKNVPVNYYQIQDISENFCCREITVDFWKKNLKYRVSLIFKYFKHLTLYQKCIFHTKHKVCVSFFSTTLI
jgi:hypothetical protein